ncbi:MAG: PQQ-binding-like beta-propeller repeat protein [Kofleriaceae bacterium]|nr:PQQ-binding-like beta-propeller repeat protein [Kofleriaceae bacterium]
MTFSRRRFLQLTAAGLASAPLYAAAKAGDGKQKIKVKNGEKDPARDPYGIKNRKATLPDWDGSTSSASVPGSMRMFRGNLSHTYYGSGTVPSNPTLKWKFRMSDLATLKHGKPVTWQGTGWTGQALKYGDYVFVGSTGGHFHCFEAYTGELVWVYRAQRMFKGSPSLYKNRIYVPNVDNHLRCLDAATGDVIWDWAGPHDMDSSPRIYDGMVYVGGEDGNLKCFDAETGDLKWKEVYGVGEGEKPGSGGIESSLAIVDGIAYFGHLDGHVRAYDLAARKLVWKAETGGDTDCSPLIVGDRLFIGAEEGKPNYHCFDRKTGKELWSMNMPSGCWSTAAAWNDTIIVGGNNGKLYCLDQATGKEKWVYKSGAGIWSSPSVVDGKALFGSYDRYYRMVDAETGEELWKYDMGDRSHSGAAVEDGHIWVGSASGWFYCFG